MKFYNEEYTDIDDLCSTFSQIFTNTQKEEKIIIIGKEKIEEEYILYLKNHADIVKKFHLLNNDIYDTIIVNKSFIELNNVMEDENNDKISLIYATLNI